MQKDFNIQYNIWKKTFKTIQQLKCFVGHPVPHVNLFLCGPTCGVVKYYRNNVTNVSVYSESNERLNFEIRELR